MKTFDDYYEKHLSEIKKCAKRDKITIKEFLQKAYHKTIAEYKKWMKTSYNEKNCHSFWKRECENKGKECYHCNQYFSMSEYDKMTKKQKSDLGIS